MSDNIVHLLVKHDEPQLTLGLLEIEQWASIIRLGEPFIDGVVRHIAGSERDNPNTNPYHERPELHCVV